MPCRAPALVLATLLAGACAYPVEGDFASRGLDGSQDPATTIVIIHNHGFSSVEAGTYRPVTPPILRLAAERNPDVVVFSQVRNSAKLTAVDHASYIESAIAWFHGARGVPLANIILAGQSCGGWGSLQAAAFTYPEIGGVLGFAPTCHGRLPHSTAVRRLRAQELAQLADHLRTPGTIFLYEGDSFYDVAEWDAFASRLDRRAPELQIERVSRARILELCARCATDSHGAYWDTRFASAFFESRVQALIERVRGRIRARTARP
jgi:dienelactone hydrolase